MKRNMFKIVAGFWYGFEIGVVIFFSVLLCTGQIAELLSTSPVVVGVSFIATTLLYLTTELQVSFFRKSNDRYRNELDEMNVSYGKLYRKHLETTRKYKELRCLKIESNNRSRWDVWIKSHNGRETR